MSGLPASDMPAAAAAARHGRAPWAWRHVAGIGIAFIAAVALLAGWDIARDHRFTVDAATHELDSQALTVAEQTARSVQLIDLVLRHIGDDYASGRLTTRDGYDLRNYLAAQAIGLPQIEGLRLLDASGREIAAWDDAARPTRATQPDAAHEPNRAALTIGAVSRLGGSGGPWVIPVERPIASASGAWLGAVVALARVDYFRSIYSAAAFADGTKVSLLHLDGTLLARQPAAPALLGERSALFDAVLQQHAAGNGAAFVSPIDRVARLAALAPVSGYPLSVVVARDRTAVLAPWRARSVGTLLRTLLLAALAVTLILLLRWRMAHLSATRASLQASRERFALAAAGADVGIWDWDISGNRVFASPRTLQIYGFDGVATRSNADEWFGELLGPLRASTDAALLPGSRDQWFAAIRIHPDDVARRDAAIRSHLDGDTPAYFAEFRVLGPGDVWRWVSVRGLCVRDAAGRPLRMAGSVADIDSRKRAEDALRKSEQRFALAVAGSDDGLWDFDYVADEAFASRRAREILGLPVQPEVQRPLHQWIIDLPMHPDDVGDHHETVCAHLDGRTPAFEGEWRFRRPGGGWRWVRVRGVCVRDGAGKPLRMAGSVSDIDLRRRAEQALRESEERYELAVTGSDDGVWDWDLVAGLAFESSRARELQGLPTQPEQQPLAELLASLRPHPDDAARRAEMLRGYLAGETTAYECEYRVLHDDGQYRWIRVRALCVRGDAGQPLRIAGSVSDIDGHKRAQEALRRSEERFAMAVAGSNDGILDWNVPEDRMYVSERALRIAGIDAVVAERTRADWMSLLMPRLHPDDAWRLRSELGALVDERHQTHDGEYRVSDDAGGWRWIRFRGRSVRDERGRALRWAGSVSDIDAGKQVEAALRRSDERYQLAVAGSNEGLWDWDLASDRLFLSPRAQELLWLEPIDPQQTRRYWIDHTNYHPDDVPRVRAAISAHLRGRTDHFMVEYRLQHHSGEWRWYRQRGIAVRDAEGRATRMAGSMEDIDDRKKAEAQRECLELQLRQSQKLEAMGTLAGGIAHDFNNILAAILGYGELAQKDAAHGTRLRRHIDAAISAAMRAKSLVERILAFSRSGVGERGAVHVQSVIDEALGAVAASLQPNVRLQRHLEAGDAAVIGDATQLHQVVMNLCANAVHAMPAGGTLTVSLQCTGDDKPDCATCRLPSGHYVRLRVRDSGSGIAADVRQRIFDPFFTTKDVGVGTGLGLSLVHGIVSDLGGGIDVQSAVGEGSTFTVFMPRFDGKARPERADESVAPQGNGETVLLVDDEDALVRLGEEMLAALGYEPVGFNSAVAALRAFTAEPQRFDAVLSDEAMPRLTGSELARSIRLIRADVPIVLMSGYVSAALSARAQAAGVAEVLTKPLASRDIAQALARALPRENG